MQITAELDHQHIEKLQALENQLQQNTSEFIAWAIDKIYQEKNSPIEDEKELSPLYKAFEQAGFIGCIETDEQLSTTYKEKIDFSSKYNIGTTE